MAIFRTTGEERTRRMSSVVAPDADIAAARGNSTGPDAAAGAGAAGRAAGS
jgi:hypothetical protein